MEVERLGVCGFFIFIFFMGLRLRVQGLGFRVGPFPPAEHMEILTRMSLRFGV